MSLYDIYEQPVSIVLDDVYHIALYDAELRQNIEEGLYANAILLLDMINEIFYEIYYVCQAKDKKKLKEFEDEISNIKNLINTGRIDEVDYRLMILRRYVISFVSDWL